MQFITTLINTTFLPEINKAHQSYNQWALGLTFFRVYFLNLLLTNPSPTRPLPRASVPPKWIEIHLRG
jgi:hypothetical protein